MDYDIDEKILITVSLKNCFSQMLEKEKNISIF